MPETVLCPGCEIACELDKVQCNRGLSFAARHEAGEDPGTELEDALSREVTGGPVGTGGGFRGSAAAYLASGAAAPLPGTRV